MLLFVFSLRFTFVVQHKFYILTNTTTTTTKTVRDVQFKMRHRIKKEREKRRRKKKMKNMLFVKRAEALPKINLYVSIMYLFKYFPRQAFLSFLFFFLFISFLSLFAFLTFLVNFNSFQKRNKHLN